MESAAATAHGKLQPQCVLMCKSIAVALVCTGPPLQPPTRAQLFRPISHAGPCWNSRWRRVCCKLTSGTSAPSRYSSRNFGHMQPGRLHLSHADGDICTESGHSLLQDVPSTVTTRPFEGPQGGYLLGMRADGPPTSIHDAVLGQLACTRFLACARIKLWWVAPVWGRHAQQVPPETQFLLTELAEGGPYAILLPVIDHGTFRCTLRAGRDDRSIVVRAESGDAAVTSSTWTDAVYVAAGQDPFSLVESAVTAAASVSGGAPPLSQKKLPASVDGFGWCTWDAFYSRVSAAGIVEGLESLAAAGALPQWLIIDDGWQLTAADIGQKDTLASKQGTAAPTAPADTAAGRHTGRTSLWTRLNSVLADGLISMLEFMCQWPTGSTFVHALMQTPVKRLLQGHYIATSDHAKRITSVEANAKFATPQSGADTPWTSCKADLGAVVSHLKQRFGLRFVYAWHAMHAYWSGVSTAMQQYNVELQVPQPTPGICEVDPSIVWNPQMLRGIGLPEDMSQLHTDMHSYLSGCGVDGVKVDVQGSSGMFGSGRGGGPSLSASFHTTLEASIARHFPGNHAINCMAHSTENLYRTSSTAITRASDDFYPHQPASHTIHLGVCAFNSLFIAPVLLPDWDMFHSRHPAALLHATARAASGGPVYVSDAPGKHDPALLARLVLPDGSVLRAAQPGRPTADVLFCDVMRDNSTLLKVWNMNAVNGLVLVANIQGSSWDRRRHCFATHDASPATLRSAVRPHDVAVLGQRQQQQQQQQQQLGSRYVVYSDCSQRMAVLGGKEALQVELAAAQSDILVVAPLLACGAAHVAPIGLVNMLNAGGAILRVTVTTGGVSGSNGGATAAFDISLRGAGMLLMYADRRPSAAGLDGRPVDFRYDAEMCTVRVIVPVAADLQHKLLFEMKG